MADELNMASMVRTTVSAMREASRQIVRIDRAVGSDLLNELERALAILADALELKRLANTRRISII
jgi:hypothetical protein